MMPFIDKIQNAEIYIGQNAGNSIARHISNAKKSIKIISPYIVDNMVKVLLDKQNEGVTVSLLTSDDERHFRNPTQSKVLQEIIIQDRHVNEKKKDIRKWILRVFLGIALMCFAKVVVLGMMHKLVASIFCMSGLKTILFVIFIEFVLLTIWRKLRIYTYSYRAALPVTFVVDPMYLPESERAKCPQNAFFHVKLFIIDDDVAFVGSVNLTTKGMNYNVESCITIKNKEDIQKLTEFFDQSFKQDYYQMNLDYYGSIIYSEPIN